MFIFAKFLSLMFFVQIWSHNLDFFKLTEISKKGTSLYVYYSFNVYFFKILFIHIFGQTWSQNQKFFQIDWKLVQIYIAICLFQFWCLFFQFFCQSYFWGKFRPIIWSSTKWLKFHRGVHCCMLITIFIIIFSKFLSIIFFEKFSLKILSSPNWLKFRRRVHYYMLIMILMFTFS